MSIEGRTDDVIQLPDAAGRPVSVYPSHFQEAIELVAGVRDYLITQLEDRIEVAVVATRDVTPSIADSIRRNLAPLGLEHTRVDILLVKGIDRAADGAAKPKRVRALPRDAALS